MTTPAAYFRVSEAVLQTLAALTRKQVPYCAAKNCHATSCSENTYSLRRIMRIYRRALLPLTNLLGLHKVTAEATPGNATFGSISDIQQFGLNMGEANATRRAPVIAISHGGGPSACFHQLFQMRLTFCQCPSWEIQVTPRLQRRSRRECRRSSSSARLSSQKPLFSSQHTGRQTRSPSRVERAIRYCTTTMGFRQRATRSDMMRQVAQR
jgi:hypothetical protein